MPFYNFYQFFQWVSIVYIVHLCYHIAYIIICVGISSNTSFTLTNSPYVSPFPFMS